MAFQKMWVLAVEALHLVSVPLHRSPGGSFSHPHLRPRPVQFTGIGPSCRCLINELTGDSNPKAEYYVYIPRL